MPYLVLFDIDGTILRLKSQFSRGIFAGLIKEIFGREIALSEMPDFAGMTDLQILYETVDIIGIDRSELKAMLPVVWQKMEKTFLPICIPEHIELVAGAREVIIKLNDDACFQLGLLTGNFRANAYMKLKSHGLDRYFPFGAFGCEDEDRNRLALMAIDRANEFAGRRLYSAANTVIVGDTPRDIACARVNGIAVISTATGMYTATELMAYKPDEIIETFDTFFRALKKIMKERL